MKKLLIFVALALLVTACSQTIPEKAEAKVVNQELLDEFNQHVDLYNKDIAAEPALDKNDEQSVADFLEFASVQINHLNEFYNFFEANKAELKENGVDTFTWNNNIVDIAEKLKSTTRELGYPIE